MSKPTLWFECVCQPGTNNTLSFIEPYNTATVRFSCNQTYQHFLCRCTKDGQPYGRNKGYLVQEYTGERPSETIVEFLFNSIPAMTDGDGLYRVGLYVQNMDGEWNEEDCYFLVQGGGYFRVGTTHDKVIVKE